MLAEKMKSILEKHSHSCDIYRDKELKNVEIVDNYDLLCIGSPTHVGGPAFFPFRGLLKKIAKRHLDSKNLISFATSGDKNGWIAVCESIKKRLPNLEYIGCVGCKRKDSDEAIVAFERLVSALK